MRGKPRIFSQNQSQSQKKKPFLVTLTLILTENRGEGPDLSMEGEAFRLKKNLKDFKDFDFKRF